MSCVIGMNLGTYVMIASDTRTTYRNLDTGDFIDHRDHVDDKVRVFETNGYLIAGSGYVPLLERVKARLCAEWKPTTIGESLQRALDIIADERAAVTSDRALGAYAREHALSCTAWMISLRVRRETGELVMVLAVYHPSHGHQFHLLDAGNGAPLIPFEDAPAVKPAVDAILSRFEPCTDTERMPESIERHADLMRDVTLTVSRAIDCVGPQACISIHAIDGRIWQLPRAIPTINIDVADQSARELVDQ